MEMNVTQGDYFTSYEDLEIHRLMLEDEPRTDTYRRAILGNKNYFKDKVVMDVGCGTGILSIFCAQAGAKKVYAIEASNLVKLAKEIVKENNFEDIIEVIHSKVEDATLPGDLKVDAIVSEWMGFYLLHEGMLDSVLVARDKFLKEGGEMFPESAVIYVAPCSVPQLYNKWTNFYGVSLSTFAKQLRASKSSKPEIMQISQENLLGAEIAMAWINLREDTVNDLNCYSIQHVVGASKTGQYQGLCVWFECNFPELSSGSRVVLSTGPEAKLTHWKQTVILLPEEQNVDEQEPIAFLLDMNRDKNSSRRYNLELTLLDPQEVEHPVPCTCDMTKCILIKVVMSQHTEHAMQQNGIIEDDPLDDDE
ncbi:probable protein arginine N-methyltransferase 6.1 [Pararge aegeria]|uniref:type I protein arginine methyltransferase n=1 Tax=Pararge aegeria aegeria TaxID=348720 RepID=A0A8S4RW66_9NEOP|nr:probable protein arginine N-methyltransferase 6.1 [Pararge aegeria]CAH2243012.1 jg10582 [Pararge aegeria aegeria]